MSKTNFTCEHNYQLLDVEKRMTSYRYSNTFYRTTRLFCKKCGEQKEHKEQLNLGWNDERPDWTYNIKK
jgi:hypothetical protein